MADGYTYKAKINGEWVDINLVESPAELTTKLEKDEEWAKVVRCKDCKHAEFSEAGMTYCPGIIGSWVEDDWFCADGERREDGANR